MAELMKPEKKFNDIISSMVGRSADMNMLAYRLGAIARRKAAGHGSFASKVKVRKQGRGKDRYIHIASGEYTRFAEYGHVHNRNKTRWVRGLHIMRNSYLELVGGGG